MKSSTKTIISLLLILSVLSSLSISLMRVHGDQIQAVSSPRNLKGIIHGNHIALEWDAPEQENLDIDVYHVYRGLGEQTPERIANVTRTNYVDEDIEPGRTYKYYVTAVYQDEYETSPSNTIQIKADGSNVPTEPRELSTYPGDSQLVLEWEEPVDDGGEEIIGYSVYRGTDVYNLEKTDDDIKDTLFTDINVTNGIEYYYAVGAVNGEGESEWTGIVTAEPRSNITVPASPVEIFAFSGDDQIELYWFPSEDKGNSWLRGYRVYRIEEGKYIHLDDTKQNYYLDETVELGSTYRYIITAVNGQGESGFSQEVEKGLGMGDTPQRINEIQTFSKEGSVEIKWELDEDIKEILIFRGEDPDELIFYDIIDAVEGFEDQNVEVNTTYHYSIKVIDGEGRISANSEIVEAIPEEKRENDDDLIGLSNYMIYGSIIALIIIGAVLFVHKENIKKKYIGKEHGWEHGNRQSEDKGSDGVVKVKPKKIEDIGDIEESDKSIETGQIEVNNREDLIDD